MAMSGSVDFVVTRDQIITDAYDHLGAIEEGETLTSYRTTKAARYLNKMLKALSNRPGYRLWTLYEGSFTVTAAAESYTIGSGGDVNIARPRRILSARITTSGNDVPIKMISRQEYFDLPDKDSEGIASVAYYDPQFTGTATTAKGTLYVWPVAESGSTDTIKFTYEGYIQDFDGSSDDTPLPPEWAEALSYGLAVRLAPGEGVTGQQFVELKALADEFMRDAELGDVDTTTGIEFGFDHHGGLSFGAG